MLEELEQISLLLDFYGCLLSDKQLEFLRLYHEENYSLQEIADEFGVSRQGVYDGVKKAQNALAGYESKLHLVERFRKSSAELDDLLEEYKEDTELCRRLTEIWRLKD